jgi:hypothetical protein
MPKADKGPMAFMPTSPATMINQIQLASKPVPFFPGKSPPRVPSIESMLAGPASASENHSKYRPLSSTDALVSTAPSSSSKPRSSSWSTKDDERLIQARTQGLNWNQIAPKYFPSKSPNACRKRHERLMERQNAEQWDGVKLDVLAQAYMDTRREMWSIMAARVGEKWTTIEQKVWPILSTTMCNLLI